MDITFYVNNDERIRLVKSLKDGVILNGSLRDSSSIMKPVIMVERDVTGYNYCYIEEFGRYYYVNDVTIYRRNMFIVSLECDVLMSWSDEIKELSGVVSRLTSGSQYASRDVVTDVRTEHRVIEFSDSPFTENGSYILVAKGDAE